MANIAQTVNVLQAMILTNDDAIVKTPSFYVFKMYKVHHDATLLPADLSCESYQVGDENIPSVSLTASKDMQGKIHLTLSNLNPNKQIEMDCEIRGMENVKFSSGNIITGAKINSYNDFGKAEQVTMNDFKDVTVKGNLVKVKLPAKSVVMVELN